ncbi:sugar ABC transporter substrate-binding protein [Planosporangium sp. 12N6]
MSVTKLAGRATRHRAAVGCAALLMVLGTAACGGGSSPRAVHQDPKAQLEIWVRKPAGSPTEKVFKDLAATFTAKTGIPTNVTALFDDFETKLQQAAATKKLPDLVINDTDQVGTMVKQGIVRPVDKSTIAGGGNLTAVSWSAAQASDNKYYGVPFSAQSFALLIRSDWRKRVGAGQPKNWDDLVSLAKAFTDSDPDGNGKADTYGFNVPGATKRGYMSWFFSSFLWSGGGDFFTARNGRYTQAVNSPAALSSTTWFKGLFCDSKVVQPGAVTMETTPAHQAFESGKVGIYFTGPYLLGRFDRTLGRDRYEVVALPAGPSGRSVSLAEGENIYLMAGSRNQAGQQKFAEYAISTEGQTIGMSVDNAEGAVVRLPVNTTIDMPSLRKDPRWDVFAKAYSDGGRYFPHLPNWTAFRQSSAETINGIVANCGSDPKAELDKLASSFGAELTRQGVAG